MSGSEATFASHVGSSCIDVTLATPNLASKIRNWRLSKDDSFSDHKTILFNLETTAPEIELKRDYNKLDTEHFKLRVEQETADWVQPDTWDVDTIEAQEKKCHEIITKVLDELVPLTSSKITPRWLNWWNDKLQRMKDKLRKWYRQARGNFASDYIKHRYQTMFKEYKKEVRKAKKDSWIKFCSNTESTSELARLAKIIRYHPKFSLGLLKRTDGSMASTPEESLEILTNATFPGSTTDTLNNEYNPNPNAKFKPQKAIGR